MFRKRISQGIGPAETSQESFRLLLVYQADDAPRILRTPVDCVLPVLIPIVLTSSRLRTCTLRWDELHRVFARLLRVVLCVCVHRHAQDRAILLDRKRDARRTPPSTWVKEDSQMEEEPDHHVDVDQMQPGYRKQRAKQRIDDLLLMCKQKLGNKPSIKDVRCVDCLVHRSDGEDASGRDGCVW